MGTIAEKLSYLNDTKTIIKNAIVNKGVAVADSDTFRSYAGKVEEIINKDMLRQMVDETNSADYLFYTYDGDDLEFINKLDTSNITSMKYMFYECKNIKNISFGPDFKTHNVTNMNAMFRNCYSLISLNVSNFNTSNVTNMYDMFCNCSKLTSLDVSNFDTTNVTSMNSMFWDCSNLTSLNLSNFDTSKVTDMGDMFYNCNGLQTLDLSSFDMSNVTNASTMFDRTNIQKITLPKALNTNTMFKLPSTYVLRDDPSIAGDTLNAFASHLSTDTQKRDIERGYKISIIGYDDLLTDGTETNSTFIFGNILGQQTTVTINGNTITIGGKTITANSNETSKFIEWQRGGVAITGTLVFSEDETITAVYELPMPIFNIASSGVAGVSRYRLPDGTLYDFSNDKYDALVNNETQTVQLKKYTSTTPTQVVIPSQMIIDNKLYSVDINSTGSLMTGFFANSSKATNIQCISINETYITGTNMNYFFTGCKKLTEIDLSGIDLANITKYSSMFGSAFGGIVPKTCLIYVKDQASLDWMTSHFSSYKNVQIKGA